MSGTPAPALRMMAFMLAGTIAIVPSVGNAAKAPEPTKVEARYEVLGVRTGQTPDEVSAALRNAAPEGELRQDMRKDPTGKDYVAQVEFRAITPRPGNTLPAVEDRVQVIFSSPASGNRALAIERHVEYQGDSRPLLATLDGALVAKFGTSPEMRSSSDASRREQDFIFGSDGHLLQTHPGYDPSGMGPCSLSSQDVGAIGTFSASCGSADFVWNVLPDAESRVDSLTVVMKDMDFARAAIALDDEAARKAQEADMERLRKVAPPKL